ncbi:MAG: bifunctional adenosylcobinamide kinase/adenosylcobinamide-phosphate guanylyltransferase, partial [Lachnospiraceae bacterium]|nr:bifunctional adenosylcobinamide kinase/adenosylcobinamide-phosphate guanylyltransferase [Lachnospiraceae bacterium]
MITLVIGRPESGKSLIAEEIVCGLSCENRYYLATMLVYDESGKERIKKHRSQREGKDFVTLEVPYRIDRALNMIDRPKESVLLLECIANLVGNEMYENPE